MLMVSMADGVLSTLRLGADRQEVQDPVADGAIKSQVPQLGNELDYGVEC